MHIQACSLRLEDRYRYYILHLQNFYTYFLYIMELKNLYVCLWDCYPHHWAGFVWWLLQKDVLTCLLGITMVLKYQYGMPKPNYIVGMAHGILFILYVFLLLQVGWRYKWSRWKMAAAFVASLLPFGTFYADVKWFRE
jgi:integral membrane protein